MQTVRKMAIAATTAVIASASLAAPGHAALLSIDSPQFGLGSLTRDTETGLDWLNVTETQGMSFNEVRAQMAPGGTFADFAFAEFPMVQTLWNNAGIPDVTDDIDNPTGFTEANFEPVSALIDLIGMTSVEDNLRVAGADVPCLLPVDGTVPDVLRLTRLAVDPVAETGLALLTMDTFPTNPLPFQAQAASPAVLDPFPQLTVDPDESGSFGHYLVRATQVPVPPTLALLAGGLIGFAITGRARRRGRARGSRGE